MEPDKRPLGRSHTSRWYIISDILSSLSCVRHPNKWLERTSPSCHAACKARGAGVAPLWLAAQPHRSVSHACCWACDWHWLAARRAPCPKSRSGSVPIRRRCV
jgi:hypothetical protein